MRWTVLIALVAGLVLAGCGEADPGTPPPPPAAGAEATHIHGLGVNPADGALFVATHTGLFRAEPGEERARRVGDSHQDTMGFTVVGPDSFLGSGHPDATQDLPPLLGLIRSEDAGRSWQPVSLLGEADFHVLRAAGPRVYGFDAPRGRLMVSDDGGRSWTERRPPAALVDLAIDPNDVDRVLAASPEGLFLSEDAGRRWRPKERGIAGLLAWDGDGLALVDGAGAVHTARGPDGPWRPAGRAGGAPAALVAEDGDLLLALHTNEVMLSGDRGATWSLRATL